MLSGCFLSSCYVSLVPQPFSEVCCPVEPNWSHPAAPSPDSWTKFAHSCESNSTMTGAVVKQPVENQMPWIKTSLDDIVLPLRKLIFLNPSKAMERQHRQAMLRSMPLGAWLARAQESSVAPPKSCCLVSSRPWNWISASMDQKKLPTPAQSFSSIWFSMTRGWE